MPCNTHLQHCSILLLVVVLGCYQQHAVALAYTSQQLIEAAGLQHLQYKPALHLLELQQQIHTTTLSKSALNKASNSSLLPHDSGGLAVTCGACLLGAGVIKASKKLSGGTL